MGNLCVSFTVAEPRVVEVTPSQAEVWEVLTVALGGSQGPHGVVARGELRENWNLINILLEKSGKLQYEGKTKHGKNFS